MNKFFIFTNAKSRVTNQYERMYQVESRDEVIALVNNLTDEIIVEVQMKVMKNGQVKPIKRKLRGG